MRLKRYRCLDSLVGAVSRAQSLVTAEQILIDILRTPTKKTLGAIQKVCHQPTADF